MDVQKTWASWPGDFSRAFYRPRPRRRYTLLRVHGRPNSLLYYRSLERWPKLQLRRVRRLRRRFPVCLLGFTTGFYMEHRIIYIDRWFSFCLKSFKMWRELDWSLLRSLLSDVPCFFSLFFFFFELLILFRTFSEQCKFRGHRILAANPCSLSAMSRASNVSSMTRISNRTYLGEVHGSAPLVRHTVRRHQQVCPSSYLVLARVRNLQLTTLSF